MAGAVAVACVLLQRPAWTTQMAMGTHLPVMTVSTTQAVVGMGEAAARNRNVFSIPQTTCVVLLYHTEAVEHKRGQEGMFKDIFLLGSQARH